MAFRETGLRVWGLRGLGTWAFGLGLVKNLGVGLWVEDWSLGFRIEASVFRAIFSEVHTSGAYKAIPVYSTGMGNHVLRGSGMREVP